MSVSSRPIVAIVHSPKAGQGGRADELQKLQTLIQAAGNECQLLGQRHALSELLGKIAATEIRAVVAAGGDGTIRLAASQLTSSIPLVPMPMGTENLLSRYFGYTACAEDVWRTIERGESFQIDAGLATFPGRKPQMFLVMATAGFDAEVVRAMHLTRKGPIRKWNYAPLILRAMRRYAFPMIHAAFSDPADEPGERTAKRTVSAAWLMAFNLPCYAGNLNIEPDAQWDDGLLDLIALRDGSNASGLAHALRVRTGRHLMHPGTTRCRLQACTWSSESRVPVQLDGDYAGRLPVQLTILPARTRLYRPATST